MTLLLDTHVFLWWVMDAERLSARARLAIADADARVVLSVASIWEMAIKRALGKLSLPAPAVEFVSIHTRQNRFGLLSITPPHAAGVEELPHGHGDPFDRLLVAQALTEAMTLVTSDGRLRAYGVPTLW